MKTTTLNSGSQMPLLGLGTWELAGRECEQAVLHALEAGYRLIDTASLYGNEEEIGKAIRKSAVPREEIFVTTKLWTSEFNNPEKALDASLKRLGMDYVDLYLIHWPMPHRNEVWRVFEKLVEDGKCRAIGVSNFTVRHLKELLKAAKVVPAVNQVEFSPFLYQKELLDFCKANGVQLEAYSPLTRGEKLEDAKLKVLAGRYNKTPAQIILRWLLQHEVVAIPKSSSKERLRENADVFDFEISAADMKLLNSFDENFRTCWNPNDIP